MSEFMKIILGGIAGFIVGQIFLFIVIDSLGMPTDGFVIFGYNTIFVLVPTIAGAYTGYRL